MKRKRGVLLGLSLALAGAAGLYNAGLFRLNFPSQKQFPVRGVDVSHHQGHIGWFEASLNNVQFAYIKATEGTDYRDPQFLYNWTQCPKDNIARGAYHFFNFCASGQAQARNFLQVVPADPQALPPALDLEFSGSCRQILSQTEMRKKISAFMKEISVRFPGPPVFYATPDFYKRYLEGHEAEYPPYTLWIRNVIATPKQTPCVGWTFWQYGSFGKVPGIPGRTDLNVFCGSTEEFLKFNAPKAQSR